MLKQPQYAPMPVEQQVMIIYAVTNGFLDDVPVNEVREFESAASTSSCASSSRRSARRSATRRADQGDRGGSSNAGDRSAFKATFARSANAVVKHVSSAHRLTAHG